MNASPYSSRADSLPMNSPNKRLVDQQTDFKLDAKGNWEPVQNITEERYSMAVLSSIAQPPNIGIEDRLQAIQETLRRAHQHTATAIDSGCDEGSISRSRNLKMPGPIRGGSKSMLPGARSCVKNEKLVKGTKTDKFWVNGTQFS